ncbi:hypothetical protein RND81_04G197700 [Saponaria officinalis]|uniref:SURF1-like protein n=1 Tax=Saponaria officinalis TaxID=3572 RepID=A0AAW1LNV1_SAPOF
MRWVKSISRTLERINQIKSTNHKFSTTNHDFPSSITCFHPQISPHFITTSSFSTLSSIDQNPTFSHPQGENVRGIWSKMLLFVPGAITFGLGTWQIFRRQDKIKMLDYRKERLEMDPIKFDATSATENQNTVEFRKVVCRGAFDEKKSVYVGPRSRSISGVTENGYYIITPLLPISGDPESVQHPVLVNRGWVPRSWRDKALESFEHVEETKKSSIPSKGTSWRFWSKNSEQTKEEQGPTVRSVEVVGVIRESEKPSIFVPANDPVSGQWFYVDVPAIAHAAGLPKNTIYIEDINENVSASNPYPVPKDVNTLIRSSVMPQDHLNYMLTWYSLSAAVTFMAYKRLKPRKIRR